MVTSMVDAAGTSTYAYTAGGFLWTEDGPWASDTVTNTYNQRLRTGLTLLQSAGTWTNSFGYDLTREIAAVGVAQMRFCGCGSKFSGREGHRYLMGRAKRLTNVTSPAGTFTYSFSQPSTLIQKLLLPNTSYITNTYDTMARLKGTYLKTSGHVVTNKHEYAYNVANQRINSTNLAGTYYTNTYDKIGQLKAADSSVNTEDRGYLYDAAWNLNKRTNNGVVGNFTVDSKNQLVTDPTSMDSYDNNGNLTARSGGYAYSYDDENRLTSLVFGSSYRSDFVYDGKGRLRQRLEYTWSGVWTLSTTTCYVYDGMRVIQERNASNVPGVSYTRGTDLSGSLGGAGGIGGLLGRSHAYQTASGNWTNHNFYHADGNGNVTYVLNGVQSKVAEYRYDPFGNTIAINGSLAGANVYRFSSKEIHVNSGLYYYGYRFYDPNLQRWLNRDPIHEVGFLVSKGRKQGWHYQLELNLFTFLKNDAVNLVDSLGLRNWGPAGGRCCNHSGKPQWWLDEGVWKPLPDGGCTGFWDDCDGQTCGGGFYWVGNGEGGSCDTPGKDDATYCKRRWTPNNPAPDSIPPGPPVRPGHPGKDHRGAPGHEPPPNYPWSER